MTVLQHVTLIISRSQDLHDCAHAIGRLGKHKNSVSISIQQYIIVGDETQDYWPSSLNSVSPKWNLGRFTVRAGHFPAHLGSWKKKLASLESLHEFALLRCKELDCFEGFKVAEEKILKFIAKAPNLENCKLMCSIKGSVDHWSLGSRLSHLTISSTAFTSFHTFEMFDKITHLDFYCDILCDAQTHFPVRNLRTLAIRNADDTHVLVPISPNLKQVYYCPSPKLSLRHDSLNKAWATASALERTHSLHVDWS